MTSVCGTVLPSFTTTLLGLFDGTPGMTIIDDYFCGVIILILRNQSAD